MPIRFTSREKRDELAERLVNLAAHMQRSFDQGHDGRMGITDEMIGDIKLAACCVGLSEITSPQITKMQEVFGVSTHEQSSQGKDNG